LLSNTDATVTIWSLRRPLDAHLEKLFARLGDIRVWITDQPGKPFPVDVVVVPVITKTPLGDWPGRMLAGLDYLPLEASYADEPTPLADRGHDVLLSLGGADPTRATLRLLPGLGDFDSTVVIGPGFVHAGEVKRAAKALGIRYIQSPDGLQNLLRTHRMVITAGGNTLMEAAASGTPALVTWEDPHERDQGEVFERLGAAIVLGKGELLDPSLLRQQTEKLLDSPETLSAMMIAGRRAVDGRGAVRIADVILEKIRQ
jgi:spore coat polysaccharide biosynthesis predicted glycosyltransferase SpsG